MVVVEPVTAGGEALNSTICETALQLWLFLLNNTLIMLI